MVANPASRDYLHAGNQSASSGFNARNAGANRLFWLFSLCRKKGYSGVGIYSKHKADRVIEGLNIGEIDAEGRYLECQFDSGQFHSVCEKPLSIISLYLPSGSSGEERQALNLK